MEVPEWLADRFRKGYHPTDMPPGTEELYYKAWKDGGGTIDPHPFMGYSEVRAECGVCGLLPADPIHTPSDQGGDLDSAHVGRPTQGEAMTKAKELREAAEYLEQLEPMYSVDGREVPDSVKAGVKLARAFLESSTADASRPTGMIPLLLTSQGAALVTAERERQTGIGYDATHDDRHDAGEMIHSAIAFLCHYIADMQGHPGDMHHWREMGNSIAAAGPCCEIKWKGQTHSLQVAGALICAELDRILRADAKLAESHTDKFAAEDLAPDAGEAARVEDGAAGVDAGGDSGSPPPPA